MAGTNASPSSASPSPESPSTPRRIAFLGATKGMGRALARRLAAGGDRFVLLGRDPDDLERSARDLEVRGGAATGSVATVACDLADTDTFAPARDAAAEALGEIDTVIVTAGVFETQDAMEDDLDKARRLLDLDFTHTILFCEHAKRRLLARGGGTLCVFSSVAGDRGRKPVAIYGAAKAGLSSYLEALDHKHHLDGLVTIDVKPGFVKTGMTAGLKAPPFAGEPEAVAERVERAIERSEPLVYTPAPWGQIMLVIRCLPRFLMRRLGF
ncbi:MAG: SDR family NAD(P)-dependent oxidoreductase [Acidobacteriota bacterium]